MRYFKRVKDRDDNTIMGSDFTYQMTKITIRKQNDRKTSYCQIHHENEDDLDDCFDSVIGMIHLIENPDLPSLSFDIIDSKGKSILEEVEKDNKDKEQLIKNNPELEDQYIPSFYNNSELELWMDNNKEYK